MTKLEKFVHIHFNFLSPIELKYVPEVLAEMEAETKDGYYDRNDEYALYDVFDDKLYRLVNKRVHA
jgi:hypothetical protein